jgi:hypothetical protein
MRMYGYQGDDGIGESLAEHGPELCPDCGYEEISTRNDDDGHWYHRCVHPGCGNIGIGEASWYRILTDLPAHRGQYSDNAR